ncbi:MAG: hypothetical protein CM15mP51_23350 [Porticoccaceae bacterium]|nr:MAG: hypothetical protein CM15mP51_23350 [Porticoccaceae bacterium]
MNTPEDSKNPLSENQSETPGMETLEFLKRRN